MTCEQASCGATWKEMLRDRALRNFDVGISVADRNSTGRARGLLVMPASEL